MCVSRAPTPLNLATNNFGVPGGSHLDMTAGSLQPTGNPWDVGIEDQMFQQINNLGR